ncbi:hypothetical protein Bbelb_381040 [Branchiostoma belcheri]|nr:hypothetical protein Bbelb_381040 [Branchiostoma belcheri]
MSIKSKVGTAAAIMAMVFVLVYAEDAPAELDLASTACAEGEVPDGLGHCVACDTCRLYPDSPYCTLCGNPGKVTKTPDQWKVGVGIGVPALVIFATLAVLLYRLWYKRRQDEEQQMGEGNQGGAVQMPVAPQIQDNQVRIQLDGQARRPQGPQVTIRAEQETGEESAGFEPSIPIQAEDAAAGNFAGTAPPTGQQLQPSDEEMPLISHDDNAATVPK